MWGRDAGPSRNAHVIPRARHKGLLGLQVSCHHPKPSQRQARLAGGAENAPCTYSQPPVFSDEPGSEIERLTHFSDFSQGYHDIVFALPSAQIESGCS